MSSRGSFFIRLLGALLMLGVLFAVGMLAFRAGQAQGYALGSTVSGGETSIPPIMVPGLTPAGGPIYSIWGWPHLGLFPAPFLSLFCLIGLGFMFLFALGAIFRPRHWYRHCGDPQSNDWHGHWHAGPPPWVKEKGVATSEPDQSGSPAVSGQSQGSAEPG
jgi:hypothetical protein